MISDFERSELLRNFPNIEVSYENIIHKTVHSALANNSIDDECNNLITVIPEGTKCFAWFTVYRLQNVCILLEISSNKSISNIKIVTTCFHDNLSYGSIFYGSFFTCKNTSYFSIEDVYYYKGKDVSSHQYIHKLEIYKRLFTLDIKQQGYNVYNSVIFALPIMTTCIDKLDLWMLDNLPYKIASIAFRDSVAKVDRPRIMKNSSTCDMHNSPHKPLRVSAEEFVPSHLLRKAADDTHITNLPNRLQHQREKQQLPIQKKYNNNNKDVRIAHAKKDVVFKIQPDIQNDIYHLFVDDGCGVEIDYGIAYIGDYKTSVMMNRFFRSIKENENLDALEESDDEEEFEDGRLDKFVHLDRKICMVCVYNHVYKKWVPVRIATDNETVIYLSEIRTIEHDTLYNSGNMSNRRTYYSNNNNYNGVSRKQVSNQSALVQTSNRRHFTEPSGILHTFHSTIPDSLYTSYSSRRSPRFSMHAMCTEQSDSGSSPHHYSKYSHIHNPSLLNTYTHNTHSSSGVLSNNNNHRNNRNHDYRKKNVYNI